MTTEKGLKLLKMMEELLRFIEPKSNQIQSQHFRERGRNSFIHGSSVLPKRYLQSLFLLLRMHVSGTAPAPCKEREVSAGKGILSNCRNDKPYLLPTRTKRMMPDVPSFMLAAFGRGGLIGPLALNLLNKGKLKVAGEIFKVGPICCLRQYKNKLNECALISSFQTH